MEENKMSEPLFNIGDFTVVVWHIVEAVAVMQVFVIINLW